MTFDPRKFRDALGRFATGVTVVTGLLAERRPVGLTVNAFASVSLDPPLVLICLDKVTSSLAAFVDGGRFAVNVLSDDQRELSLAFSSEPEGARFDGLAYDVWDSGCPILPGCLANLECTRLEVYEGGDHVIVVGRVDRLECDESKAPLLFFGSRYSRLGKAI